MSAPLMSVVVPAHDEEMVLRRLLGDLAPAGDLLEIVVVANACTDATAEVARARNVRVVELREASKTAALNAGDEAAAVFPRAYLDADVLVDVSTLLEIARRMVADPSILAAAPRLHVDTTGASRWVRSFYRVWAETDYRTAGHIGSGLYVLSRAGRGRFGEFPSLIADDRFVQTRFTSAEVATFEDLRFMVRAPRTLRAQIRRGTRIQAGNRQLGRLGLTSASATGARGLLLRLRQRPVLWRHTPAYLLGYGVARVAGRFSDRLGSTRWNTDRTTR